MKEQGLGFYRGVDFEQVDVQPNLRILSKYSEESLIRLMTEFC